MCGIAGIVESRASEEETLQLIRRMTDLMEHRGPDGDGHWAREQVGLGHRRLAIIDVAGSPQPMLTPDERYILTYNGEIYNFQELRAELEAKGIAFKTSGDTEVLLQAYAQWGQDVTTRLRGMFAFAIWDQDEKTLFAARDRLGQKPFYYHHHDDTGQLAFASEVKPLLWHDDRAPEIDPSALAQYLVLQYTPGETCLVRGIKRLLPAHQLFWQDGKIEIRRYWAPQYYPKREGTFEDAVEQIDHLLEESVRLRLISDVPLGCFLSGGLDSSAVAIKMAEQSPGKVKTFSIGFNEAAFDEAPHAQRVADIIGADHHEFYVTPKAGEVFGLLAWHLDDLMGDPSAIPQYYLSRETRSQVTVALSGDGGDESLAGYERYSGLRRASKLKKYPRLAGIAGGMVGAFSSAFMPSWLTGGRIGYVAEAVRRGDEALYATTMTLGWPRLVQSLLHPDLAAQCESTDFVNTTTLNALYAGGARDAVDQYMASDLTTYLPGDLLVKVDRMTMATSLEARSPFLDHQLTEVAARLPVEQKFPNGNLKAITKEILKKTLPQDLIDRPKAGFGVPLNDWFAGELSGWVRELLLGEQCTGRGFLNRTGMERLLNEHVKTNGRAGHGHRLWLLVLFELWCRTFLDQRGTTPINVSL